MWNCRKCNAEVDDGFEVCWSCGTTIDGQADPSFVRGDAEAAGQMQEGGSTPAVSTAPATLSTVAADVGLDRAEIIRRHLQGAGIAVFIADAPANGTETAETTTLQVREADGDRARAIIRDIPAEPPPPPGPVETAPPAAQEPAVQALVTSPPAPSAPGQIWEPPNKAELTPEEYVRALECRLSAVMDEKDVAGWKVNPAFDPEVNAFIKSHANNAAFLKKAQSMQQNRAKYFATMRALESKPKPVVTEEEKPLEAEPWAGDLTPPPAAEAAPKSDAFRRGLRWLVRRVAVLLVVLIFVGGITLLTLSQLADQRLQAIADKLDESDPKWQWDSLQQARPAIAELANAAPQVEKAAAALPEKWPANDTLVQRLSALPARVPLSEELFTQMSDDLAKADVALLHAGHLANFGVALETGRYPTRAAEETPRLAGKGIAAGPETLRVAQLLWMASAIDAEAGKHDLAQRSCRALLMAGRSVGDDPDLGLQLARCACQHLTCTALERALGQGVAPEQELLLTQKLLMDEAKQPSLRYGLRGYRAWLNEVMKRGSPGATVAALPDDRTQPIVLEAQECGCPARDWLFKGWLKENRALACELLTDAVEMTKLPVADQPAALDQLEAKQQAAGDDSWVPGRYARGAQPVALAIQAARAFQLRQAELRCAIVAVAAERYRLANDQWPAKLEALVPDYLSKEWFVDPFNGQPLRLKKLDDGLLVYSVGPDRADNDGRVEPEATDLNGKDVGFRLWNTDARHKEPISPPEAIKQ